MRMIFKEYGTEKWHIIDTDWINTIEEIDENTCEIKYSRLDFSGSSLHSCPIETLKVKGDAYKIIGEIRGSIPR